MGRAKDVDFGPYDLAPWTGQTRFQWELDLFGKIARARDSAHSRRRAACWDLAGARLVLAAEIAEARFRIYRLREEAAVLSESIDAFGEILKVFRDREQAGIIAETDVHRATAEQEKLKRHREELILLGRIAEVELAALIGGSREPAPVTGRLPRVPAVPGKPFCELVASHPSLLAAEERLRAAFQIEEAARLDLLPSFTLRGTLMGASPQFALTHLRKWERSFGPSLDLPVFDPARLATLDSRRGKTHEACARYRLALVETVRDVDSAYLGLDNRSRQLGNLEKELAALSEARRNVTATFQAGVVSQIEVLESERSYLQASRARVILHQTLLNDHLSLIRALGGGGGCTETRATPVEPE